jgi:hypothetical protein
MPASATPSNANEAGSGTANAVGDEKAVVNEFEFAVHRVAPTTSTCSANTSKLVIGANVARLEPGLLSDKVTPLLKITDPPNLPRACYATLRRCHREKCALIEKPVAPDTVYCQITSAVLAIDALAV